MTAFPCYPHESSLMFKSFLRSVLPVTLLLGTGVVHADWVDFETLPLPATGYNNGNVFLPESHRVPFTVVEEGTNAYGDQEVRQYYSTDGFQFGNRYAYSGSGSGSYDYWSGWSWSNVVDTSDGSYLNQYASWPGGGSGGNGESAAGQAYAVGYGDNAWFNIPDGLRIDSVDLANTTYAALTMRDGINGGKRFGGTNGTDPDWFAVTLNGFDGRDAEANLVATRTFYLADFRFEDSSLDYVLDQWETVSLVDFDQARQIRLEFSGSDVGAFGLNTPTYVALDQLQFTAVPEPVSTGVLWAIGCSVALVRRRRP